MRPKTASASVFPWMCGMPQSSRVMMTFCACARQAVSSLGGDVSRAGGAVQQRQTRGRTRISLFTASYDATNVAANARLKQFRRNELREAANGPVPRLALCRQMIVTGLAGPLFIALVAVLPCAFTLWRGRRVARFADDPALPEL